MELEHLRMFLAVAECGSFTEAAKRLFVSHSTTSRAVSALERELVTFCYLAAQGGCEPQLTAHASGNMNMGNDRLFLIQIVSQCLPYIGYPRSLNALTCIDKAAGLA